MVEHDITKTIKFLIMKKYGLLALIALFSISLSLSAQEVVKDKTMMDTHQNKKWTAQERADKIEKELSLTADEKAQVINLFEQQDVRKAEFKMQNSNLNDQEKKAKYEELGKQFDEELGSIIGPEKLQQWQTICKDKMDKKDMDKMDMNKMDLNKMDKMK